MSGVIDRWSERAVKSALGRLGHGSITIEGPDGSWTAGRGAPAGTLMVHDPRFYRQVLSGGEIGLGESYMAGEWSTPDLPGLIGVMLANRDALDAVSGAAGWLARLRDARLHRSRDNTRAGSDRNIRRHYDLGNRFFELFLDVNLLYSCGVYDSPDDSLEQAQVNKLRLICDKLQLGPGDRVLEIGTGWGGFALYAATRYGCHVTTTTISREQHAYAEARFARAGECASRIDLRCQDYRDLDGAFDKIVSIEMFEAVGLAHYDQFFAACDRLLTRDGAMLLQTITVDDWRFADYRRAPNWISKHVFPGAELASLAEVLASLARVSRLGLHHAQQIGTHYARTLHQWRERFLARLDEVRQQGFDERFTRMWDLYLAYCEVAFRERHIGDVQLLLTKSPSRRLLFDEPWHRSPSPLARPDSSTTRGVRCVHSESVR
jgi:cyclopropane-fatty-acyl-phospholipid synthase